MEGETTVTMLEKIGTAVAEIIDWGGQVVTAVFSESGSFAAVQDLVIVGIAVSAAFVGIKFLKSVIWGS